MSQLLGREIRLNRLFDRESGKFMAMMVDHAIGKGSTLPGGLVRIEETIGKIVAGQPNAISMQKGIAYNCFSKFVGTPTSLIFRCSSFSVYHPTFDARLADVEEAVMAGADAIAIGAILGGHDQPEMLEQIAKISKQCTQLGMPLVGHIYPRGEGILEEDNPEWQKIAYASRCGAELGVDILKIHHNGPAEELSRIVEYVPTKVVLAGGNMGKTLDDYLIMTRNALDAGVAGVAYGTFVWSYKDITSLVKTLKLMIHKGASVKEAKEYLAQLEGGDQL